MNPVLFIREQMMRTVYDLRPGFIDEPEFLDIHVWSPISCRYTNWIFRPKVWKHRPKDFR